MRVSHFPSTLAASALAFSAAVNGLNILITNDDGFGTSNIREMYKAVKAFGHNVYIVASTQDRSGTGGTLLYAASPNLTADTEFGIVKAGSPSLGTDPNDSHIWYYNGTPSTCVSVALDYVLPKFANFSTPDLVLSGPNFGLNLGPFLYTVSGTVGATYTAVERSIPAIAFSVAYSVQTAYFSVNSTTAVGLRDPATIAGQLAANLAQQLIVNAKGGRILPLGYGINVNIPYITSFTNASCVNPPFVLTRLTGGAWVLGAQYVSTAGVFTYGVTVPSGANTCINGDCSLPGEQEVMNSGCRSAVSVFTVDYDAPSPQCGGAPDVRKLLAPLVQSANSSVLVGGLNGTAGIFGPINGSSVATSGNVTSSAPKPTVTPAFTGGAIRASQFEGTGVVVLLGGFVAAAFLL